jgi:hypothetical protein
LAAVSCCARAAFWRVTTNYPSTGSRSVLATYR